VILFSLKEKISSLEKIVLTLQVTYILINNTNDLCTMTLLCYRHIIFTLVLTVCGK
jgi:hypothetical protein